jgi:hypothetical protein
MAAGFGRGIDQRQLGCRFDLLHGEHRRHVMEIADSTCTLWEAFRIQRNRSISNIPLIYQQPRSCLNFDNLLTLWRQLMVALYLNGSPARNLKVISSAVQGGHLPRDEAMETAWATRSRDLSRRRAQILSCGADPASSAWIQIFQPNIASPSDRSPVLPCDARHRLERCFSNLCDGNRTLRRPHHPHRNR